MAEVLRLPDVAKRLHSLGVKPGGDPPAATGAFLKEEAARWHKVIVDAGIKLQ
jgi:tripartite-type tricarboxylate transporter receptor subunit TctC